MIRFQTALMMATLIWMNGCATTSQPRGEPTPKTVKVAIETSLGAIVVELWPDKAPKTVENFLRYVDEGFYDGLIFHRVIGNFVIQGGGYTANLQAKAVHDPIENEARADTPNQRGTLAMARTSRIDSATSQFFINLSDNDMLDHRLPKHHGYAVFGRVLQGMEVADSIAATPRQNFAHFKNLPIKPIIIRSIRRLP